jgi:hypothetical protein
MATESMAAPASLPMPMPAPQKSRTGLVLLVALFGIAAVALVGLFGTGYAQKLGIGGGGTGKIVVTAAGANNAPLPSLRVLVDGSVRCESSPCTVAEVSAGTHFVTVEAPGFVTTAARAISVEKGGDTALHFDLEADKKGAPAVAAAAPEEPKTVDSPPPAVADPAEEKSAAGKVARVPGPLPKKGDKKDDKADDKAPKSAGGEGTLNINSIPVANVVLDGRPVGSTPLMGLKVSAGPHSIVFVHPEKGRKAAGATVTAGKTSTVAVRF